MASNGRISRNVSEKKRRDQFNSLIQELCSMVSTKSRKMDKSTVLKATISFLKTHNEIALKSAKNAIKEDWKPSFLSDDEFSQLMLEALDGFMIVFNPEGRILYASDSVTSLLRHLPKDLENRTIYELVHEDSRPDIFKILSLAYDKAEEPVVLNKAHTFDCYMQRGSMDVNKEPSYDKVNVSGSFQKLNSRSEALLGESIKSGVCFVATVRLEKTQLSREMATFTEKGNEFTSRHSLDWKFLFLDHRAPPVIGYLPFEVLGTSVYDYYHQDDLSKITKWHEALMQTSEGTSSYYRFLTKGQEWIWLKTRFYITYNQWNSKPEFIVCAHVVVNYAEVREIFNREICVEEDQLMSVDGSTSEGNCDWESTSSRTCMSTDASIPVSSSKKMTYTTPHNVQNNTVSKSFQENENQFQCGVENQSVKSYDSVSISSSEYSPVNANAMSPGQPEEGITQEEMAVIQLQLQEQLLQRHHIIQEKIHSQQEELQRIQQQLVRAQQLMIHHQPFLSTYLQAGGQSVPNPQAQVTEPAQPPRLPSTNTALPPQTSLPRVYPNISGNFVQSPQNLSSPVMPEHMQQSSPASPLSLQREISIYGGSQIPDVHPRPQLPSHQNSNYSIVGNQLQAQPSSSSPLQQLSSDSTVANTQSSYQPVQPMPHFQFLTQDPMMSLQLDEVIGMDQFNLLDGHQNEQL
ncbi:circadian locomoter output cycles protein kaput-like isoform X2 [Anneissia japonica]|uniref:circadian locomoter output cycles protein kaput-like isoform X2 n=2 Tax=Anneissia japonica TaxID=1529436 RepID=UPI001425A245|nr:circadian locomoter output cycles protein kaput-like isoform X2 [Anneissia japonica]